ncbi:NAD(P)-binding Rossmann-fold containing protein [Venustampulla echinocandica]|uniref:NAD(P)-binding Rossmann-fold containing protein n=1 Tax=Venustampulla echinocandica TaxID=2656787 RepID=A0A370TNQ1_9HELO|nr:NAD(P)-binding Rossmann-fold containing protein [Venustampulla echinocandica]RDL37147.1 NAD(P)-binding Rossmann-fold containing protein [Venustampulla echinocandica]
MTASSPSIPDPPVWFITGCSSGFGLELALIALGEGHKVIATSRNPSKTPSLVSQVGSLGGKWLPLDVCAPEAELAQTVEKAIAIYGRIDILVNSAGYAILGALETISVEEVRAQMETNYFGPLTLTRLVLPTMRARRSGTIVQISSTAGIEAKASRSAYCASKWALEAMSEALYNELEPLGVRVLLVEPGAFRSGFAGAVNIPKAALPKDYEGTITQQVMDAVVKMGVDEKSIPGDVHKGCRAIFDVVMKSGQAEGTEEFLRLPLGKDSAKRWRVKIGDLQRTLEGTEKLWSVTDADD